MFPLNIIQLPQHSTAALSDMGCVSMGDYSSHKMHLERCGQVGKEIGLPCYKD